MVGRDTFRRRVAEIERLLRKLGEMRDQGRRAVLDDEVARDALERRLQLLGEVAIDLANHVIAARGWSVPGSYREAFAELGRRGVIEPALAAEMEALAGLRNILVHMYLAVDHERLFDSVEQDLGKVEAFVGAMVAEADREG